MSQRRVHLVITGRVQNVAYRYSATQAAKPLGVTGWVRNLDSGEVEAVAEGSAVAVEAFIAWCRQGPPAAAVSGVDVREEPATGEFKDFAFRH